MRPRSIVAAAVGFALAVAVTPIGTTAALDATPTLLAKQAKALGVKARGTKYRFREVTTATDVEGRLTLDVPTAWKDRADSHFRRPSTNEAYGVGLRATTDADKFHETFDVPGFKLTATTDAPASFDAAESVANNAFTGCRNGSVRPFDNGVYEGKYQVFDRCDGKHAAAVVVAALDARGDVEILFAGQALTKADLAAFDRILRTAQLEKPSV